VALRSQSLCIMLASLASQESTPYADRGIARLREEEEGGVRTDSGVARSLLTRCDGIHHGIRTRDRLSSRFIRDHCAVKLKNEACEIAVS